MYWTLETLLIEISLNFFFCVDQDASVMQTDEYGRVISKKLYHSAKHTAPIRTPPIFQGQNAHTFDSLTAEQIVIERIRNLMWNACALSFQMGYLELIYHKY